MLLRSWRSVRDLARFREASTASDSPSGLQSSFAYLNSLPKTDERMLVRSFLRRTDVPAALDALGRTNAEIPWRHHTSSQRTVGYSERHDPAGACSRGIGIQRSEEHTSELQSHSFI